MDYGTVIGQLFKNVSLTDPTSLQRFFYSWLTETSSELEHMHLMLPPPCPGQNFKGWHPQCHIVWKEVLYILPSFFSIP